MQVHHQGTLGRRGNHMPGVISMDSPPQRTTAGGTLSGASPTPTTATRLETLPRCQTSQVYRSWCLLVSPAKLAVFFFQRPNCNKIFHNLTRP